MHLFLYAPYSLLLALSFMLLFGCGGGGGDSSNDPPLLNNACSNLGLKSPWDVKIFSGTQCTNVDTAPVVAVRIQYSNGESALCSGTLISSQHVLSAGHCFVGQNNFTAAFVLVAGEIVPATSVSVHPQYFEDPLVAIFNDAAVLTLSRPVPLTPIPLLVGSSPVQGEVIDIFGYGLDENENLGLLQSGQMLLTQVTTNHLFSEFGSEGSNTCLGDSGGPALVTVQGQAAIVGITSTGIASAECKPGDISLFTNIQNPTVLTFILSVAPEAAVL